MSQIFSPESITERTQQPRNKSQRRYLSHESSEDEDDDDTEDLAAKDEAISGIMTQSQWKVKLDSKNLRVDFSKVCSICLSEQASDNTDQLIRPCLCSGYRSYQHKRCIEEWIEQTGITSCPFCKVIYDFTKKRKNFFRYIQECELDQEFMINLGVFLFSLYLFMVGLAICYNFIFAIYECEPHTHVINIDSPEELLKSINNWRNLERLVDCRRSVSQFEKAQSWPSIVLFCFTCFGTVILFIGITTICLNTIFRYYIKYVIWSKTNFKVCVRAYPSRLQTGTIARGLQVSGSTESAKETKRAAGNNGPPVRT